MATDPKTSRAAPGIGEWLTPGRFALLLTGLILVAFPEVIFGSDTFIFRDFGAFGYPLAFYHRENFWRGDVPLWNPLSHCGVPYLAQWNTMVFYPLSLFYLLLPLSWSLGVFCLLHLLLAGSGMYFLAEAWTRHRLAAAAAGVAFAFNGLALNCLSWPNNIAALAWMPWIILLGERAWSLGGRWLIGAAFAGATQMLAGAPEVILFTWLLLAALGAVAWVRGELPRGKMSARFAATIVLVMGLAAIQLLPFFDLLKHSQRTVGYATGGSAMPGWGWANFFVPLFHCRRSSAGFYFQAGQVWTTSYYLGIGILLFAVLAAWVAGDWRTRVAAVAFGSSLALALGDAGHLYDWLREIFPAAGFMNYPIKFVVVTTLVGPLLAGVTLSRLLAEENVDGRKAWRLVLIGWPAFFLCLLALVWFGRRYPLEPGEPVAVLESGATRALFLALILAAVRGLAKYSGRNMRFLLSAVLLLLLWLDGLTQAPGLRPAVDRSVYQSGLPNWRQLRPRLEFGGARAMVSRSAFRQFSQTAVADPVAGYVGQRLGLFANCNLLDNIPKIDGFYSLFVREEQEVRLELYQPDQPLPPLADFLGVGQITAEGKLMDWQARPTFMPLVTIGQKPIFENGSNTLRGIFSPDFAPRDTVYLPLEARSIIGATQVAPATVVRQKLTAHQLDLEVAADRATCVVVAQTFYHPWKAYLDGRPVSLWRANYAYQAVAVPSGRHQVQLIYEDPWFRAGRTISGLTFLACVAAWLLQRRRRLAK
jgi:hypothetical protein